MYEVFFTSELVPGSKIALFSPNLRYQVLTQRRNADRITVYMQTLYIEISYQIVYEGKTFGSYFYVLRICKKRITWSNKIVITSSVERNSKIIAEKIDGANKFPDSHSIN